MIPSPIHKVLSTLSSREVRHLLMGGQACVFYGAAEFSRDCNIVLLADAQNFARLQMALDELEAVCIAVPPFEQQYLERGHAVHFRCHHHDAAGIRLDVMTKMRGCDGFESLWERRLTLQDNVGTTYELLGIEDLVKAKKTQRDKDWPMIRRLVDAHYEEFRNDKNDDRVRFWMRESRSPEILNRLAVDHPNALREIVSVRPLLKTVPAEDKAKLDELLSIEQDEIKKTDAAYWQPLKNELELLRFEKRNKNK